MINRRDFVRGTAIALAPDLVIADEGTGPYASPTIRFDKANQHKLPNSAFTVQLTIPPTIRPRAVKAYEEILDKPYIFGPDDPKPVGKVFHGVAKEWVITPEHWHVYGCDPSKTGDEAWTDRKEHFGKIDSHDNSAPIANWGHFPVKCYKIPIVQTSIELIDKKRKTKVYAYGGTVPGSTLRMRIGQPAVVRFENHLETETSVHFHGGHNPSHSDGFPSFYILQGKDRDYFYPNIVPMKKRDGGGYEPDKTEAQSTCWYHDHAMDATSYNVSKGLAGLIYMFGEDELKLIHDRVLPGLGPASCKDPEIDGVSNDSSLESDEFPGHYAKGKEPYHNPYDLPLVLQDKVIDPQTGQIAYDNTGHNGYLGDTFLVNGVPWPVKTVENRKYRLRLLNGSNARVMRLRILPEDVFLKSQTSGLTEQEIENAAQPFLRIGKDSWLWSRAVTRKSVVLSMANRADLVIDFKDLTKDTYSEQLDQTVPGPRVFYLVNTMPQFDGRGPKQKLEDGGDPRVLPLPFDIPGPDDAPRPADPATGRPPDPDCGHKNFPPLNREKLPPHKLSELNQPIALMKFVVDGDPIPVQDDATVIHGTCLIARDEKHLIQDADVKVVREFIFERGKGAWQINGRFYDPTISNACPTIDSAEEWVLRNGGGGWWHPIHMHLESHQLVSYEKDFAADAIVDPADPPARRALGDLLDVTGGLGDQEVFGNHDTTILGPNTVVRIRMRFRTFPGPFVFHCHNLEHEDMRMMFNFETVYEREADHDPNVAPAARTHGKDVTLGGYMGELPWEEYPVPGTPVDDAGENVIKPRRSN